MTGFPATQQLPTPQEPPPTTPGMVQTGQLIPPIERIKIFSPEQWEAFVLEWADSLRGRYARVEKCGGAGDMGRDVVAYCGQDETPWDNYQCKHYDHPLQPHEVWVEFGKLVYHTFHQHFAYPQKYTFVAPQGAGTSLSKLLKRPDDLRSQLIAKWDGHCRDQITNQPVALEGHILDYLNSLDFSIFDAVPPLTIIDQHATTRWHVYRFGGGLPARPRPQQPPDEPLPTEATYVRQLLLAYGDHLQREVHSPDDLAGEQCLREHFSDSRVEFYSAESLRSFSRDTLPPGEFEGLQEQIHWGIRDQVRASHADGYARVVEVVRTSRQIQLTNNSLVSHLSVMDRGGVCHQLANDGKVRWVDERGE